MKLSIFSFLILSLLVFSSCEKGGSFDEKNKDFLTDKDNVKDDGVKDDKNKCFKLVYPVTYNMPDGTTLSGGEEELHAAIKTWYETHPDVNAKPALQYPVQVIFDDIDVLQSVSNEEEMLALKKDCEDELEFCVWDGFKVSDANIWESHILEPLVTNDECGECIVSGKVKYVKTGIDFAYVIFYGDGECDALAYLVTFHAGDDKDKVEKCKFKLDCDPG